LLELPGTLICTTVALCSGGNTGNHLNLRDLVKVHDLCTALMADQLHQLQQLDLVEGASMVHMDSSSSLQSGALVKVLQLVYCSRFKLLSDQQAVRAIISRFFPAPLASTSSRYTHAC
jgi:hypothetical protein